MSLQLPAILSPPTPCIPSPALTVSPLEEVAEVALPFTGRRPVLGFAHPTQARQCIRPYRVQHCFIYGLAVRLRLPPTPPFDDAVSFDYGQPVFCPMGTSTPLLVRTLRRTHGRTLFAEIRKLGYVGCYSGLAKLLSPWRQPKSETKGMISSLPKATQLQVTTPTGSRQLSPQVAAALLSKVR